MYYIANVRRSTSGEGVAGKATDRDGSRVSYTVTGRTHRVMEMQATVSVRQKDGTRKVYSRVRRGVWIELLPTEYGLGNRDNPLVPFVIVAADQRHHPFGSRVYVPVLDGVELVKAKVHDGVFWVGDTGGNIKGRFRFDLFVGDHVVFLDFLKTRGGSKDTKVVVQSPPKTPSRYNVRTRSGVRRIVSDFWANADSLPDPLKTIADVESDAFHAQALVSFQKRFKAIPALEHGKRNGAVTTWFLSVAAADLAEKAAKDAP